MIIIKLLGGLGNQMFQYAVAKVIADKHGVPLKMDLRGLYAGEEPSRKKFELSVFGIQQQQATRKEYFPFFRQTRFGSRKLWEIEKKIRKIKTINGENFEYKPEIIEQSTPNMYLAGLFQSEKYFANRRKLILELYKFPEFNEKINREVAKYIKVDNSVSIHFRRGDLVNNPAYNKSIGVLDLEYYYKAVDYIVKHVKTPVFYIFSDDPGWVFKNFSLPYPYKIINWNQGEKHWRDMQLMSLCKHNIIANSTFSWWGAWLNQNPDKIVIAPKRWFKGEFEKRLNTKDLIPESWIKI